MNVGARLRALHIEKKLSQEEIEKRSGLLQGYICRLETGQMVPNFTTLEKMARALKVPLYAIFYEGKKPPRLPKLLKRKGSNRKQWRGSVKELHFLNRLRRLLGQVEDMDRRLLLFMANEMALRKRMK
jgi:transcriptional regulator with XRE-family HTH domain